MDKLIRPSVSKILLRLLFIAGTVYAVCSLKMRTLFLIDKKQMFTTIGFTVAIALLIFWGLSHQ
jgi:hypothetical protein